MYYIGIDVGGTNLAAGLVDAEGHIRHKLSRPVDRSMTADGLCLELAQLAGEVCAAANVDQSRIGAVGAGFPGLVDNDSGVVIRTPNMPFRNTRFRELFQRIWDAPVYLGNDANCAAIGEYWAGAAKGCDPVVVVTLGTGIGGGMVSGGKLFAGYAGSGMEIGHMIIHPDGPLCGCGSHGCWEQYGSATALIRLTQQEMQRNAHSILWELCGGDIRQVQGRTAFQGARLGDPSARRVLDQYLKGLAVGLVNLVNILHPQVICLGGGISNAEDSLLLEPLRAMVLQNSYDKANPTRLVKAALGNDAGIVGAALLCNMV